MFHYFGTAATTKGDSLPGWQVECVNLTDGSTVSIYADENETAIETVSGIADRAVSDAEGNYDFFVNEGTYSLRFYDATGTFRRVQRYLPMYGNADATVADAVADAVSARDEAVSAKGDAESARDEAVQLATNASTALAAGTVSDLVGTRIYASKALLDADLVPADGLYALVIGDAAAANNDLYKKSGATTTGSWTGPLGFFAAASASANASANAAAANAALLGSVASLNTVGAVGELISTETVGRATTAAIGTTQSGNATYVFANPVTKTGAITAIRVYGKNSGGTLLVKRFTKSTASPPVFTQVGSDYSVSIAAGVNALVSGTGFTAIPVNAGEYIGFFAYSATGKVAFSASTTADGLGYYQSAGSSGNLSTFTATGSTPTTVTRIELGFDNGYSAFESTMPARLTAAEAYATPFKAGTTALQDITGAITVFNAREKKDIAGGKVREWYSQDRRLVATTDTRSEMPTFITGLSPYIDFGTAAGLRAYPKAKLREVRHLPDSTLSPFAYPPGGFVCTGSAMRDDGKILLVNDGRTSTNAPSWGANDKATLFILDRGTLAKRYEFDLKAATGGVGFLGTAQGIDWFTYGGFYHYMIADTPAKIVRCFRDNNDGTLTYLSAFDVTPNSTLDANGVAIDRTLNEIYIGSGKDIVTDPTNGQRIDVHDITITTGTMAKTFKRTFICHVDVDQLCLVYPETYSTGSATTTLASDPYLFCTSGGNGEFPDVVVYTKTGKLVTAYHNIVGPQSIEGLIVDYKTGTFLMFHDGGYHPQGDNDCSVMAIYDVELPVAGLCPDAVLIGLFGRLTTGTSTPFFGFEDATSGRAGWGVRANGSGTLQLATSERSASISASASGALTSWFTAVLAVLADGTVQARINSASATVTGSLAGLDYGLTGGAMVLGAERTESGALAGQGFVQIACTYHGSLDDISGSQPSIDARMLTLENAMKAAYPELVSA